MSTVSEQSGVAAGENASWTVHVIEYARASRQPMASLVWGTFNDPPIDTPFSFVLAQSAGRAVCATAAS